MSIKKEQKEAVPPKSEIALKEEEILKFWQENKIFEKSLKKTPSHGEYIFYDGPPFATGLPHYGHILGSTTKDVIGRYKTMRGYHVDRRWGWDCHGLPIENIVERDLGLSGHKEIEALGIKQFVEHARSKVLTYVSEWKKTVDRIGRWVDFDNSYKTMDNRYIESVWWALSELNKKNLIYEGVRVLAYCPRCETPIANSEIAMDNSYQEITDLSVYVKFELQSESAKNEKVFLLAWTTTPWTLPGNVALAVNPDFIYSKIEIEGAIYILAKERLSVVKVPYKELGIIVGRDLIGKKYIPIFDYYIHQKDIVGPKTWTIFGAPFVTLEAGTGIVHIAPAFGEDDMALAKREGLPWIIHVTRTGQFKNEVTHFAGQFVKPKGNHQALDIEIIKYLAHNHKLFEKEKIVHSYPHCYRCETPLYYYALPSYFVNIQKIKTQILETAKTINWIPEHLKEGRFKGTMESAPDWTISRNRYWASPLPIWKSTKGQIMFVESIDDLKSKIKKSGNKYFTMRHGEAESNILGRINADPTKSNSLTTQGREQVGQAGENLKNQKIDLIFTSPFPRTKETAEIMRQVLGLAPDKVLTDERIREIKAPDFEHKKIEEYHAYFSSNLERFTKKTPDGEDYNDIRKRMGQFIFELEQKYAGQNILIVTHDAPLWVLEGVALGLDNETITQRKRDGLHFNKNASPVPLFFSPFPHNDNYELDLHRPYIDEIKLIDGQGQEYSRIPEVIDCWFESGSMPFAQDHYPFERPNWQIENFPADFVAEYIAQTRTWYYYTHVLSTVLFGQAPFKNVVTTGTLLASDAQKMSKSKGNYPDPWMLFNKYGVDALRYYLMSSPLMKGEDTNFLEQSVVEIGRKIIGRLKNVLAFYELYRDPSLEDQKIESNSVLDQWMLIRLDGVLNSVTLALDQYGLAEATQPINDLIDDLSTWYLRRSREKIKDGDKGTKQTLYYVLKTISKFIAPLTPFLAEELYLKLRSKTDSESVHLCDWPKRNLQLTTNNLQLLKKMEEVRKIVSLGLEARQKAGIKVRQPLSELRIKNYELAKEYFEIIKDELNLKNIVVDKNITQEILLNVEITPELKLEGQYREFLRSIQDLRKQEGLQPNDRIKIIIKTDQIGQSFVQKFEMEIKKATQTNSIDFSSVEDGHLIDLDGLNFKIKIKKLIE